MSSTPSSKNVLLLAAALTACGTPVDFTLSLAQDNLVVVQGSSALLPVSIARLHGFTGDITVGLSNPPPGVTAQPLTLSPMLKSASLAIAADASVSRPGPTSVTVEASSGKQRRTVTPELQLHGAPGTLDPGFHSGGKAQSNFGAMESAYATVVQPDGRIVVAGRSYGERASFALARYNPDGTLDTSFGTAGEVITDFCDDEESAANALALQADGKLVVAGANQCASTGNSFAIARYNPDGSLDSAFGPLGSGRVSVAVERDAFAYAVALQPDGKILVGGGSTSASTASFGLVRLLPDGSMDDGFGTQGIVTTDLGALTQTALHALVLQPDGKIIAVGQADLPTRLALARYRPDGSLDDAFGAGGRVLGSIGAVSIAEAAALQLTGNIVVAGVTNDGNNNFDFTVARYLPDGHPDVTFGLAGKVITDFMGGTDHAYALFAGADGRVVAAGSATTADGGTRFALARYAADGTLDPSFGDAGKTITDFGGGSGARALAATPDGMLVAAGSALAAASADLDFAVARYWP